jgi:hypothetical protein
MARSTGETWRRRWRRLYRVVADVNFKQPLFFRHASSPLLFAARGRRRLLHSHPPERGRAERRVPVAPLGLMRMRSSAIFRVHQDFRRRRAIARRSACGVFSVACALPRRTLRSRINVPRRWEGCLKRVGRTRFDLVVRPVICRLRPPEDKPCRLSQWYPDHRRSGLPEDSRYPHLP